VELRNMMQWWADQEDQERDRYRKHDKENGGRRNNNNRSNKGQRDYSGSPRMRKPDDLVVAVER
jgi:hypothetical protein